MSIADLHDLSPEWPALSRLLDEALDLAPAERERWLGSLGQDAGRANTLRRMLARADAAETADFLGALPGIGPPEPAGLAPGQRVGPYVLIFELGVGGMGAVWLAERADGSLKRKVALKLPHMSWTPALAERLARERDILAGLEHPNIARLYDAGADAKGRPWLALEYVEGEPIDAHCERHALPLRGRLGLLLQVARAVAHAHSRLVVHRDLKPANILVTAEGQVRLLDFGIAKLMEGDLTQETQLTRQGGRALTLEYASPEQIRGEPIGTASDVYSLAVVAYGLLAGASPYRVKRSRAAEFEEAIVSLDPPLASDAARSQALKKPLRGDLDAILNKALKKNAAERYATVDAFAQDIERHLRGEPVQARPDRIGYRSLRFVQRHRLPVAAGSAVLLAAVAGAGVSLWQAEQARRQATRAESEAAALDVVGNFMLGTFSRIAADPAIANGSGRDAMAAALRVELAKTEAEHAGQAKALGEVYGNAAAMFNFVQSQPESLALAQKELQQLRRAGEPPLKIAEAERQIALGYYRGGDIEQALAHLQAGRAALGSAHDVATRTLRSRLWRAAGGYLENRFRLPAAQAALESARRELEPDLRAASHYHGSASIDLARVLHALGDDRRPQALLDEVRTIYAKLPPLAESEWGGIEWCQGYILLGLGRYDEAESAWRKAGALYAKQFGLDGPNAAGIDAFTARALLKKGDFAGAEALLDRAFAILQRQPAPPQALVERVLLARADLHLESGDLARAALAAAQLKALALPEPASHVLAALAEARLASAQGRHDEARGLIAGAQRQAAQALADAQRLRQRLALAAAEIELAAGRPQTAREQLQALPAPAEGGPDWTLLLAADLRAAADLQQGQPAAALAWYRSPLARLQGETPVQRGPRDEALARIGFGRALQASGRPAQAQFERAAALLATQHPAAPLRTLLRAATS